MGFLGPVADGMIEQLGVVLDQRGNVLRITTIISSVPGVFALGDMRRGQSLVYGHLPKARKEAALSILTFIRGGAFGPSIAAANNRLCRDRCRLPKY